MKDDKLGEMMGKMSDSNKLKYGKILMNQDEKTGTKFAQATNNVEIGTKITTKSDTITKDDVKRYVDKLGKKQLQTLNMEILGKSDEAFEGFLSSIDFKDFASLLTRKNVENISRSINEYADRKDFPDFPADPSGKLRRTAIYNKLQEEKGINNKDLARYFNTDPALQLIANPASFRISKKGTELPKEPKEPEEKSEPAKK